jgi:photosystem II stability/assembly factor-like uncharacterized protein
MGLLTPAFGYALTDGRFVSTEDAGKTWHDLTPIDAPAATLAGGYFFDQARAWTASWNDATGKLIVYRSASGGASWRSIELPADYRDGVSSVTFDFVSPTTGWLDVERAHPRNKDMADLYATTDGGATWAPVMLPGGQGSQIDLVTPRIGFLVAGQKHDHLYRTDDGGRTWDDISPPQRAGHGCPYGARPADCGIASNPTMVVPGWFEQHQVTAVTYLEGTYELVIGWKNDGAYIPLGAAAASASPVVVAYLPDGSVLWWWKNFMQTDVPSGNGSKIASVGLPGDPSSLSFANSKTGWAIATQIGGNCDTPDCVTKTRLYATNDGGAHWAELQP